MSEQEERTFDPAAPPGTAGPPPAPPGPPASGTRPAFDPSPHRSWVPPSFRPPTAPDSQPDTATVPPPAPPPPEAPAPAQEYPPPGGAPWPVAAYPTAPAYPPTQGYPPAQGYPRPPWASGAGVPGAIAVAPTNVPAVALLAASVLAIFATGIIGPPSAVIAILALRRNAVDHAGAIEQAKTGWIVFAVNAIVGAVLLVAFVWWWRSR